MTVKFGSGLNKNKVPYYYVEIQINEDYSIKKFLTNEEVYILKLNNLIK